MLLTLICEWMCGRQLGSYPETGFGGIDGSCGATEDGTIIVILRLSSSQILRAEAELVYDGIFRVG